MSKFVLLLFVLGLGSAIAQTELTLSDYTTGSYVNIEIEADTLADGSQVHDVYKVESNKIYLFDGTLDVEGYDLVIEGPDETWIYNQTTPPVFVQLAAGTDIRDMFDIRTGASITVKNILFSGLFGDGQHIYSFIENITGDSVIADNCVFSDHDSHALKITGNAAKVSVTNCIFINGIRYRYNQFGGMPVRFDGSVDNILLENNTIVNSGRLLGNGGDFLNSDFVELHCTYLNAQVNAHELHWNEGIQANNIFYNWSWVGRDPLTIDYEAYFTPWDYFVNVENSLADLSLYNGRNVYFQEQDLLDHYSTVTSANGQVEACLLWSQYIDTTIKSDDNFIIGKSYNSDPEFTTPPDNMVEILEWITAYWGDQPTDVPNWSVTQPITYDEGTGLPVLNWPPEFDLTVTNDSLLIAGTDGLPVGDLNWFPDDKATYLANKDMYIAALQDSIENATDVYDPDVPGSKYTYPPSPSAIEDFINGPTEFSLSQNYPNPFNPSTSIAFKLDKPEKVSMKIYDVTGQLVRTVIDNQSYTAGPHIVTIDMANYSSGVYFTVLNNGSQKLVRKMMLVK